MNLNKENTKKIILIVAVGVGLYWILQNLGLIFGTFAYLVNVLKPFILGAAIAFVLNVGVNVIEKTGIKSKKNNKIKVKIKRPLSIFLSILILFAVIFFVIFLVIPGLIETVDSIKIYIPGVATNVQNWLYDLTDNYPQINETIKNFNIDWNKADQETMKFLQNWIGNILSSSLGVLAAIFSGITNFVIGLIFAVYILLQKEKLASQLKKMMQAYMPENIMKKTLKLCATANNAFTKFITGQVTEACILGFLCFIGMIIFKMPYALTISVLIGFTALIPIFGAFIGAGVGCLLIAVQDPMLALGFVIFIIILQQIEGNIIYPKVVGNSVGLPGIWVLVAVTIGGAFWGILGIAISVPLASILYALIRENVNTRIAEGKLKDCNIN